MSLPKKLVELLAIAERPPEFDPRPGPGRSRVRSFESIYEFQFPDQLSIWLAENGGAPLGPGGLFGLDSPTPFLDIEERLNIFPEWLSAGWVPISGDGCGSYHVVSVGERYTFGALYFIETMESRVEPDYVMASDVWHFLIGLLEADLGIRRWPFDEESTVAHDPEILQCEPDLLPWQV